MMTRRQLLFATFLTPGDVPIASRRHPGFAYDNGADFRMCPSAERTAETAKFDLARLGDAPARNGAPLDILPCLSKYDVLESQSVVAALAVMAQPVRLAATASTTDNQADPAARRFASIDPPRNGRTAWNGVTTSNPTEADTFGHREHPQARTRMLGGKSSWMSSSACGTAGTKARFRSLQRRAARHTREHAAKN